MVIDATASKGNKFGRLVYHLVNITFLSDLHFERQYGFFALKKDNCTIYC